MSSTETTKQARSRRWVSRARTLATWLIGSGAGLRPRRDDGWGVSLEPEAASGEVGQIVHGGSQDYVVWEDAHGQRSLLTRRQFERHQRVSSALWVTFMAGLPTWVVAIHVLKIKGLRHFLVWIAWAAIGAWSGRWEDGRWRPGWVAAALPWVAGAMWLLAIVSVMR